MRFEQQQNLSAQSSHKKNQQQQQTPQQQQLMQRTRQRGFGQSLTPSSSSVNNPSAAAASASAGLSASSSTVSPPTPVVCPVFEMTTAHRAGDPKERARILAAGGTVVNGRVMGVLEPARAIGDLDLKRVPNARHAVGTTPSLATATLHKQQEVVLASSGEIGGGIKSSKGGAADDGAANGNIHGGSSSSSRSPYSAAAVAVRGGRAASAGRRGGGGHSATMPLPSPVGHLQDNSWNGSGGGKGGGLLLGNGSAHGIGGKGGANAGPPFFVLASDGLWDFVSLPRVGDVVRQAFRRASSLGTAYSGREDSAADGGAPARRLCEEAKSSGSQDDITVLVVTFIE
jgi:hypothetical protein